MIIDKIVEPYFGENMYILIDEETKKCAVVDPGGASDKILTYLKKKLFRVRIYTTDSWTWRPYRSS